MSKPVHLFIRSLCLILLLLTAPMVQPRVFAQEGVKKYTVKNGRMYIELSKSLAEPALDSFIRQFDLQDLALKAFISQNLRDSLRVHGWVLEKNNDAFFVISKPMFGFENLDNPAAKILFTEKHVNSGSLFPSVSSQVLFGTNRFRNKASFEKADSTVVFFLRNNQRASRVMLAGSFNDWNPEAQAMEKTDSGWIARLRLSPGKYWYKFIVDGRWVTDADNRIQENDGQGNINSVYFRPNYRISLDSFTRARKVYVAGSFNGWNETELAMTKTDSGWELPVYLSEGTFTYRFIVDGRWMADPFSSDRLPNEFGEFNSVIRIGRPSIIRLDGYTDASRVTLRGSFNEWRSNELFMKKAAGGWELPYHLGPGNYEYQFEVDGKTLGSPTGSGNLVFIVQPNHTFRLKGYPNARMVYLAGDFNHWSPNSFAMRKEGDEWVLSVHLSPGKHLYKFVVDDNWIIDPSNKDWEQNEHGTGNSVIWQ